MTHSELKNILQGLSGPSLPEIFHFEGTPSESEFQKIFDFYTETLDNFSDYGFKPPLIYFNNRRTRNAFACKRDKYYIVSFNCGTIIHLIQTFDKTVFKSKKPELESLLDTQLNTLMYQLCLHFTLYHEMAHLIQNSEYLSNGLKELHEFTETYDNQRHLLELDADQFSSLCAGSHLCHYLDRINPSNIELIDHVLTIAISALMVYVLSFNPEEQPLYYRSYYHPHPTIRLSLIAQTVIDYTYQDRHGRSSTKEERTNILVEAGNIVQNSTKSNIVLNYVKSLVENYAEIKNYIESFVLIGNKESLLATDKWNEVAK